MVSIRRIHPLVHSLAGLLLMLLPSLLSVELLAPAPAAAFQYDESIDGDIDPPLEPPVFMLDLGENVISGSRWVAQSSDKDVFGFVIPDGAELVSIAYAFELTSLEGSWETLGVFFDIHDFPVGVDWNVPGSQIAESVHWLYNVGGPPTLPVENSPFILAMRLFTGTFPPSGPALRPLASGRYALNDGWGGNFFGPFRAEWDYALTLVVEPVPEPAALWLASAATLSSLALAGASTLVRRASTRVE